MKSHDENFVNLTATTSSQRSAAVLLIKMKNNIIEQNKVWTPPSSSTIERLTLKLHFQKQTKGNEW